MLNTSLTLKSAAPHCTASDYISSRAGKPGSNHHVSIYTAFGDWDSIKTIGALVV